MWVSPLSTLDAIWNSSTWLICAGSMVRNSPTAAHPARSVPPAAARAGIIPTPGIRWAAVSAPDAASSRRTVRRGSTGPLRSWRCSPTMGSAGSKSFASCHRSRISE